jgi:predicted phosphodiesterase
MIRVLCDLPAISTRRMTHPSIFSSSSWRALALAVTCLAHVATVSAEPFRIAVIPDTQWASQKWPELPAKMTDWIVANRDKENIRYVLHVGDLVQVGDSEQEWKNIDAAMSTLDGKVPYIVVPGNHDLDRIKGGRSTVLFNRFFPVGRFAKMKGFGGNFPEGSNDNSFHTFEAGGKKWLILGLNYFPSDDEIAWGNEIVTNHPGHQVILLTHSYLTHTERDEAGKKLWDQLVRKHPNMSMAFCGHLSTVHARAEGDHGNTFCEMLFDWQNDREPDPNSYFALITIDPEAGTISSRAYSPALDRELEGGRSGKFEFTDVRFLAAEPKKPAASTPPPAP